MTRRFCLFVLSGAAVAQIRTPRLGYVVDPAGHLRPVDGVAGAFSVGAPAEPCVISAAYSGTTLVVKKKSELLLNGESFPAPSGPATIAFHPNGDLSELYLPEEGELWTWRNGAFEKVPASGIICETFVREGELHVGGIPFRLSARVESVAQMGKNWLAVYAEDRIFAFREGQVFHLPDPLDEPTPVDEPAQ